ncbi:MAG TPA: peptide ABC transporter substrate-binding protein [Gemmatimonadaceae bacterium]|nr:peptide ABC transporter substrate-binding protein [Gemmatimonadaceae bacterium]
MMRLGPRASTLAAMLVGVMVTASCGTPTRASDTVVYASGADLESANPLVTVHPLSRQIQRFALLVTLARYDSALVPQPYLAARWDWNAARDVLTLHLHSTLKWHDGQPTTARDVVFTIDAARDRATGYARYGDLANITETNAVDDSTVRLRFSSALPEFPPVLAELPILPSHLLSNVPRSDMRRAPYNTNPVGNGPFRFRTREAGRRWVFERAPDFPSELGGPAKIGRLVIAVVDEPTTKFAGLVSGELAIAGIAPTMASLVSRDPSLRVISYPVLLSNGIVFNASRGPFDDVRVRRAISAAIDRNRIIDAALAGYATPAYGAVPPDNPLALAAPARSADEADSLLDAAGWSRAADGRRTRGGKPLAFTLLTVGSGDNAVEQLLQADLRTHGITMAIRQLEFGAFLSEARAQPKRFDALFTGIPGDLSLSYLAAMFDSKLSGGALDYAGFHTQQLDAAFERVRAARTHEALVTAWSDVQRILDAEAPVAWVYHSRGVQGVTSRLSGVRMDLRGEMPTIANWRLAGSHASQ